VRAALFLAGLAGVGVLGVLGVLGGCSSLLGIEDPRPAGDAGPDGLDAMAADHLAFNVTAVQLSQSQILRLHVQAVFSDGTTQDATAMAAFSSSDPAVASVTEHGVMSTGNQAGTATITAQLGDATPATMTVTVTTAPCHPVINELATGSATSAADEYVELYNGCTVAIGVDGWTLVYRAANAIAADSMTMVTLAGQMASGELRLYAGAGFRGNSDGVWGGGSSGMLQQSNGAVGLRAGPIDIGTLVDSIAYGAVSPGHPFIETNPTMAMMNGRSASRLPFDGNDTGNGTADFMIIATQTPRALNAP
jgi:hypothetical protein